MKTITEEYKKLNAELHERAGGYGSKGKAWAPRIDECCRRWKIATLLDYGCGKGSLKPAVAAINPGVDIREFDPGVPGKDVPPERADMVVCCDVLEHVEPEYIDAVIADLVRLADRVVLVAIACRPGERVLADGSTDHKTVQPPEWWARRLAKFGRWRTIPSLRAREHCAVRLVSDQPSPPTEAA